MKQFRLLCTLIVVAATLITIIISQNYPYYIDLTTPTDKPSLQLKHALANVNSPFTITCFISKKLYKDMQFKTIEHWLKKVSPQISLTIIDPFKFPGKANHFDITNDGKIIIEHKEKRTDIDVIEHMMINHSNYFVSLQNSLSKALVRISTSTHLKALLIHTSQTSLLQNDSANGLSIFNTIFDQNFIDIDEFSIPTSVFNLQSYDLLLVYKLQPFNNARLHQYLESTTIPIIFFNHPKFSSFTNQLISIPDIQFNPFIIEDPEQSLIHSTNQIIVPYRSMLHDELIGIFPYSGSIDFGNSTDYHSLATSSPKSFISLDKALIYGPYSIVLQQSNKMLVNNYLIPTNYWITQGDNKHILADMINSQLPNFPLLSEKASRGKPLIISWPTIIKLLLVLVILPPLFYLCLGYIKNSNVSI